MVHGDLSVLKKVKVLLSLTGFGLRRCLKSLPRMAGTFFAAMCALIIVMYAAYRTAEALGTFSPAVVDVALEKEDQMTALLLSLAGNMPSVENASKLVITDNDTAEKDVASGKADAAVFLPADLYNDVDSGINTHVRVVIREDSGIRAAAFRELVTDAVSILRSAEACVYTRGSLCDESERQQIYDETAEKLTDMVRNRESLFGRTIQVSSFSGDLTSYYASSLLLAVLFTVSSGFSAFYGREDRMAAMLLRRNGVNLPTQVFSRFISQTLCCICMSLPLTLIMRTVLSEDFRVFPAVVIASAAASLWSVFIFSIFAGSESRDIVYAAATWVQVLCCGGLIPVAFIRIPHFREVFEKLPYSLLVSYVSELLS